MHGGCLVCSEQPGWCVWFVLRCGQGVRFVDDCKCEGVGDKLGGELGVRLGCFAAIAVLRGRGPI